MGLPGPDSFRIRFADCELDLQSGELFRDGTRTYLQQQPLKVLTLLLARPGQLVTREELCEALWEKKTFVDFDRGLNKVVAKLRDALGDSAEQPLFIETLPRRGYRFRAEVQPPGTPPESAVATLGPILPVPSTTRYARPLVALSALALLATAAFLILALELNPSHKDTPSNPAIRSIAVLPLVNLSGHPEQDYFAEGMTDALITNLAKVPSLRVISRTSSMQYKGTTKKLPQIAQELRVDAVLEGSVQRYGDRVKVTAQLIRANDQHLWAEAYERNSHDILALQDELTGDIVDQVRARTSIEHPIQSKSKHGIDPQAYEAYLKSRYFLNYHRGAAAARKSLEYAERAAALDPTSALAQAAIADALVTMNLMAAAPAQQVMPRARAAALKALQMDGSLGQAHADLGKVYFLYDWNLPMAGKEFQRALQLQPSSADIHSTYAFYLAALGKGDAAIAQAERALDLDPVSPYANRNLGSMYYFARHFEAAVGQFKLVVDFDRNFPVVDNWLAWTCNAQGRAQAAVYWDLQQQRIEGKSTTELATARAIFTHQGREAYWRYRLDTWKHTNPNNVSGQLAAEVAQLAASADDKTTAFRYLRRAIDARSFWLVHANVNPGFDNLRSDRRFQQMLKRSGLPHGRL